MGVEADWSPSLHLHLLGSLVYTEAQGGSQEVLHITIDLHAHFMDYSEFHRVDCVFYASVERTD